MTVAILIVLFVAASVNGYLAERREAVRPDGQDRHQGER